MGVLCLYIALNRNASVARSVVHLASPRLVWSSDFVPARAYTAALLRLLPYFLRFVKIFSCVNSEEANASSASC